MANDTTGYALTMIYDELKAGTIRPVYVIAGDEPYLIARLRERIEAAAINPASRDFDGVVFDDWQHPNAILDALETPPLLSPRKLVVIRQSDLFANTGNAALKLNTLPASSCLVLIESKILKSGEAKKRAMELEQSGGIMLTLNRLAQPALLAVVAKQAKRQGVRVSRVAAEAIVERTESDMTRLLELTERLLLYAQHEAMEEITLALVDALVPPTLAVRIFDLMDTLAVRDPGRAFRIVDELLLEREAIQKISFMVLRHIRQLLVAADLRDSDALREALAVAPFVANKLQRQASRFSERALLQIHAEGHRLDVDVKRGKIDDKTALYLLLAHAATAA